MQLPRKTFLFLVPDLIFSSSASTVSAAAVFCGAALRPLLSCKERRANGVARKVRERERRATRPCVQPHRRQARQIERCAHAAPCRARRTRADRPWATPSAWRPTERPSVRLGLGRETCSRRAAQRSSSKTAQIWGCRHRTRAARTPSLSKFSSQRNVAESRYVLSQTRAASAAHRQSTRRKIRDPACCRQSMPHQLPLGYHWSRSYPLSG